MHTTDFPVSSLLLHVAVAQQMRYTADTLPAASTNAMCFCVIAHQVSFHGPMDVPQYVLAQWCNRPTGTSSMEPAHELCSVSTAELAFDGIAYCPLAYLLCQLS